jgi:hypothetical protein
MKSFVILLGLISGHLFFGRVSSLNAKAWQSVDGDLESDDFPETPYLLTRSNTAIGFSGGGKTPVDSLQFGDASSCKAMSISSMAESFERQRQYPVFTINQAH